MTVYALNDVAPRFPESGSYWIAPSAQVIGNVEILKDASVWFGAVLRGDNDPITIGPRSNIQDNSVLHTDEGCPLTIGCDVTIGHSVTLHGCEIGDCTLIGMGSVILNNVKIGSNCLIGANSFIPEGKVIPDNSLVMGAPGKVVREIGEDMLPLLRGSADVYVKNWQRFKAELREL